MELNRTYIIRVLIDSKLLTYTGTILEESSLFLTFKDRFGKVVSVNKATIQSYEEVSR